MKMDINATLLAAEIASRVPAMAQDTAQNNEALVAGLIAQHSRPEPDAPIVKFKGNGAGWGRRTNKGVIEVRNGVMDGEIPATHVSMKPDGYEGCCEFVVSVEGAKVLSTLLALADVDREEHDRDREFACPHCRAITDQEGPCADCLNAQQQEGGS